MALRELTYEERISFMKIKLRVSGARSTYSPYVELWRLIERVEANMLLDANDKRSTLLAIAKVHDIPTHVEESDDCP